jgi:A/G-specific adenine glycosylase
LPKGVRLKREAPFSGSNRFYRGRVIAALREHPSDITLSALGPKVREGFAESDLPWLYEVVQGLSRDGLAVIAEDGATYDAASDATANVIKVRLP